MWRRHPDLEPTAWRSTGHRPRGLIEHHDWAMGSAVGNLLVAEGFEVSNCGGPNDHRGHQCPLSNGGDCDRVFEADVIFFGLDITDEDDRKVLRALRAKHENAPIIVEMAASRVSLYTEELEGCLTIAQPMTRETLLDAVEKALAGARDPGS